MEKDQNINHIVFCLFGGNKRYIYIYIYIYDLGKLDVGIVDIIKKTTLFRNDISERGFFCYSNGTWRYTK